MKKLISIAGSFVLGFFFFLAGGATAIEVSETPSQTVIEEAQEEVITAVLITDYCWEIGKANELGNDCYCVEDVVDKMEEADCLIASGLASPESRNGYRRHLGLEVVSDTTQP